VRAATGVVQWVGSGYLPGWRLGSPLDMTELRAGMGDRRLPPSLGVWFPDTDRVSE